MNKLQSCTEERIYQTLFFQQRPHKSIGKTVGKQDFPRHPETHETPRLRFRKCLPKTLLKKFLTDLENVCEIQQTTVFCEFFLVIFCLK